MVFDAQLVEKLAENNQSIQFMINMSEGKDRISKLSSFFNHIVLNHDDLLEQYKNVKKQVDNSVKVWYN